ncbi:radical SAM protein [Prevotella sp. E13-27]|uniref:radical SAM protein n=1 Tax=Prevotella sp. E13-27 TaxID=2938122 RepID=UPI00200A0BF1|nr:radical SAM protein [Prevotella sp. E13-27]MCK8621896.1 radical SAM protein [Prevotella sp. E13-27]
MYRENLYFDPASLDLVWVSKEGKPIRVNNHVDITSSPGSIFKVNRFRLEISLQCDLQCDYCIVFMNNIDKKVKLMDMNTADRIVNEFNRTVGNQGDIVIIGGEPLLNWEVVKHVIKKCEGRTILFTNALKLTNDKQRFLKQHGTRILTSLDGYNEQHNRYRFHRPERREFEITCHNIREAADEGCDLGIACLVSDLNVAYLNGIADFFLDELHCRSYSFAYSHHLLDTSHVGNYSFQDYVDAICKLFDYSKQRGFYIDQIGRILRGLLLKQKCLVGCKAGSSQRTFYPDGTETICTKLDLIGKTDMEQIKSIFPVYNARCKNCVAYQLCGGGCLWDALQSPNFYQADDKLCVSKQAFVNHLLHDIATELRGVVSGEQVQTIIHEKYDSLMC